MAQDFDVIVVGARCGGSPTAMLLAQRGYRVLVVDRAAFPSDTLSTHVIQPRGVAALARWGLLPELIRTGCPPIDLYSFDFGAVSIQGTPPPVDGNSTAYAPRRRVLDQILVDAAVRAGAEVRERFTVEEIVVENGVVAGIRGRTLDGSPVVERARVVVGADGRNSFVAKAVRPAEYNVKPKLEVVYYSYWSGLPVSSFEVFIRPDRGIAAIPTNDDLTLVLVGWPESESDAFRADVEGNFFKTLEFVPDFKARVDAGRREERFVGGSVPNFFRRPYGPGWALVGDAGYNRDPITAQGISDAFRDAELCSGALHAYFSGTATFDEAMAGYHRTRDEAVLPMYDFTTQMATLEPPPPEMQQLLGAIAGRREHMDAFVGVTSGTVSPAEFFDPSNLEAILAPALAG